MTTYEKTMLGLQAVRLAQTQTLVALAAHASGSSEAIEMSEQLAELVDKATRKVEELTI